MKKRGLSELVSVVLLIAATISVGLIIFTFSRTSSERITSQVKMMSNQMECSDVQLSIEEIYTGSGNLVLKNRGTLGISNIVFRTYLEGSPKYATTLSWIKLKQDGIPISGINWEKMMPGYKFTATDLNTGLTKLELIPVISVDNQDIGCEDKILSWKT